MAHNTATPARAEVFDAMKNLRRRYALYYLKHEHEPAELGDLAEQVAAWENDTTVDAITSEQRKSVYSALYQTHLPKLEETGIVSYDRNRGVVEFSQRGEALNLYLANDPQTSVAWNRWYFGLSAVGLAGVGFDVLAIEPFAAVPDAGWAIFFLGLFSLLAAAHSYDMRCWRRRFDGAAPDFVLELDRSEE